VDGSGMPVSLQILGKPFDERGILRIAAALEDATGGPRSGPSNL
jgi:Asp-tRNA(Asn)/Glu-tRNA(Gln) amidotransferase A subunit family amidase